MRLTRDRLQLLAVILEIERVNDALIEPAFAAIAVTIGPRVIYVLEDTGEVVEYLDGRAPAVPWPTDPVASRRLRASYPTLADRQEAPAS